MAITIVGYRGTGKTTVGAELARRLGWDYVDIDPEVERRAGKSIADIFRQEGEPYFRMLESSELSQHLGRDQLVVSPGGGAILNDDNRQLMQRSGPVVWLTADVETIADRLSSDPTSTARRPALTEMDFLTEIQQVLARRQPLYSEVATIVVRTDHRLPASIVDEIISQLPG